MLKVYKKTKEMDIEKIIESNEASVSVDFKNYKGSEVIFLIEYLSTGGTETNLKISFETKDFLIDKYFPLQIDDGSDTLVNYEKKFYPGNKYRMLIPFSKFEEMIKMNINFEGDLTSLNDVNIYIIPNLNYF